MVRPSLNLIFLDLLTLKEKLCNKNLEKYHQKQTLIDQIAFRNANITIFNEFWLQLGGVGANEPLVGHFFGSWSPDGPKTLPKTPIGALKTPQNMISS